MDPRLLAYYERELQHVREMGGEFAQEFPKIAGRLGLEGLECADPYVERLLEGFAFLAARVQLKLDSEFPVFTQHLLEMVYPHYLAPTPSMAVVQIQPEPGEGALAKGVTVPRDSVLRSLLGKGEQTACEYRTAHPVTLWPIEVARAEYIGNPAALTVLDLPATGAARAAIRLRLRTTGGLTFDKIALDRLPLFLRGADELPMRLYEQLLARTVAVVVRPTARPAPWQHVLEPEQLHRLGFEREQALLPFGRRSFEGYRLVREYFAFPQRFLFVELEGLARSLRRCADREIEIVILGAGGDPMLENAVDAASFAPFCTPAVNLFPKRADRIQISDEAHEYQVIPDRTRPLDYEVYDVTGVVGYGTSEEEQQEFLPFYAYYDRRGEAERRAHFAVRRTPRVLSSRQRREGGRSSYAGSELYLSLVDADEAPFRHDLRQLAVTTLCTNRDLPVQLPVGKSTTDFTLEAGAPVVAIRCVAGPTRPTPSFGDGRAAWRLISHLSLNYLSLVDNDQVQGAAALREMLRLYAAAGEATLAKQVDGLKTVASRAIVRRVPDGGRIAFGRGLEVTLTCEEASFRGTGVYLLGEVLSEFFRKYVSINSFTETVLKTVERGEVMRWPATIGTRQTL